MTSLTPEVVHVLSRLAKGEIDVRNPDTTELYNLAGVLIGARESLAQVLSEINERGDTFATIAGRLGIHEATAARWAKPPSEDKRRRRRTGVDGE